ncbi:hypothetical protein L228DRAFT_248012 [Xylona heveae TC161]|uniref:Uncharacterized protein n=1 Tax=Xylona heveae (strain CBS 132557 / TC161) TaxID=1328760 RepID=A0A165GLI4_XYLHT|nr:hypothetical protein L228DRAFT_248012 [Xylona heveae TC161]KZF22337.1 hypothetical protein L228DRAFT_248012 [Xylona heveae TC161]
MLLDPLSSILPQNPQILPALYRFGTRTPPVALLSIHPCHPLLVHYFVPITFCTILMVVCQWQLRPDPLLKGHNAHLWEEPSVLLYHKS